MSARRNISYSVDNREPASPVGAQYIAPHLGNQPNPKPSPRSAGVSPASVTLDGSRALEAVHEP
jgi:hypothetical protein